MTKFLAWDTSGKSGTLVAMEWENRSTSSELKENLYSGLRLVAEYTLNIEATHSERLLWAIDQVLKSARWSVGDVDVFGVGVGPGSFTGLRIGLTTARTLGHVLGKPVVGVSSLSALARPAAQWLSERKKKAIVIATTDAAKGELFYFHGLASNANDSVAMSEGDRPGLWKRGVEEGVSEPVILEKALRKKYGIGSGADPIEWIAVGQGRRLYPEFWRALAADSNELSLPVPFLDTIQGRALGVLVFEAFQAGLAIPALEVVPRYLRASDAEVKLKAGKLPPGPTRGDA